MPIIIDNELSAYENFTGGRIFVIDRETALRQRIRPLDIAILNLTPTKENSEMRFMRLLSNSPLQIKITLIKPSYSGAAENGDGNANGLYKTFAEAEKQFFDGMIVTGSPSGNAAFTKTPFWKEFEDVLDWTNSNVNCTLFVCWAAQAAMYYFYDIKKHSLKDKCCGIFPHQRILDGVTEPLMQGISDEFFMPHSRHSAIYAKDIMHTQELKILAYSKRAGASIIKSTDNRRVFVMGHMEYDRFTLKEEYEQDLREGLYTKPPANYFTDGDLNDVKMNWASTSNLFYQNWLNFCIYQSSFKLLEKEA